MLPLSISMLFVLMVIGLPVAFALASTGLMGILGSHGWQMGSSLIPDLVYKAMDSDVMIAVPLYVLMAELLLVGGVGNKLYDFAGAWVRHWPGGLGVATTLSCAVFAAISGASITTALTIGMIAIPEMLKRGYDKKLVLGFVAAGGSLGILIPPSIPMMLYGFITGESVGKLFMAGMIPGVLLSALIGGYVVVKSWNLREPKASWKERYQETKSSIAGLAIPVLVIGGIYGGWFTPTESAAVGVVLTFIICVFGYRTITFKNFPQVLKNTINTSCLIMIVVVGAGLFSQYVTESQIPQKLTNFLVELNITPGIFVLCMMVLFIGLGMFLDVVSMVLIVMPVLTPILISMKIDLIWFCILLVVNLELALIHPPLGMNLFVIQGISKEPMITVVKGVLPFILIMIGFLMLLWFVPGISTFLPQFIK
jgi:C4-dicarboxylate transporter, DctM subunit